MGFWSKSLHSAPPEPSQKTWKALSFLPPCLSLSPLYYPFSPCTPSPPSMLPFFSLCLPVRLSLSPSLLHLPCFYPSSVFCLPLPLTSYSSLHFPPAFSLPFSVSLSCVFSPSFSHPPSLSPSPLLPKEDTVHQAPHPQRPSKDKIPHPCP